MCQYSQACCRKYIFVILPKESNVMICCTSAEMDQWMDKNKPTPWWLRVFKIKHAVGMWECIRHLPHQFTQASLLRHGAQAFNQWTANPFSP